MAYTVWSNRESIRNHALQAVRTIAETNVARLNGTMNTAFIAIEDGKEPPPDTLPIVGETYAAVRDAYNSYKGHFKEADQRKIDIALGKVEKGGLTAPTISVERIMAMSDAIKLIKETLQQYQRAA